MDQNYSSHDLISRIIKKTRKSFTRKWIKIMFLNEFCFFGQIPTISFRKMRSRLLIHFSFQFKRKPSRENTTLKYLVGSKIERTEIQVDQNYLTKNFVSLNSSFEKFSISDVCPTGFCIRSAA